ncbi:hypothetical protein ES703_105620 [subsurface metagenome]
MPNIFREAKQLLDKKDAGAQLSEEEQGLIDLALMMPLLMLPKYNDTPLSDGLEELAKLVEEKNGSGVAGRLLVARRVS